MTSSESSITADQTGGTTPTATPSTKTTTTTTYSSTCANPNNGNQDTSCGVDSVSLQKLKLLEGNDSITVKPMDTTLLSVPATSRQHNNTPIINTTGRTTSITEDTSSDALSNDARSSDGKYELIEYDLNFHDSSSNQDITDELLLYQEIGQVSIHEDSPAAEALRANAEVQVSSLGKAARAVHMQSVRRALKRATGKGRSRKGKPPRVPYGAKFARGPEHLNPTMESEGKEEESCLDDEDSSEDDEQFQNENELYPHDQHLSTVQELEPIFMDGVPEILDSSTSNDYHEPINEIQPATKVGSTSIPDYPVDMSNVIVSDNVAPGTVEAGKKVLNTVDPHDLLKLVRWRRKKKGVLAKTKPKSYVKGKVIDGEHELYTLSIAVMIGVRTSISRTNTELNNGPGKRWVRPTDFRNTEKYQFKPKGDGPWLPAHQLAHTFKFKDYCPVVFAYLRRMAGVNEFDFLLSVCGNANFIEFISNAKSGQFFFYSSDGHYMIKTMTNTESKFLRRILPSYFKHCCENPNTIITRFFGMYRVKLYHLRRNVKFVIMNSVYYTDKTLQSFYDLKGSVVGRDAKPNQAVLKDNDLRKRLPEDTLAIKPRQRLDVQQQLVADLKFLNAKDIMDYSMLVGVHYIPAFESRNSFSTVSFRAIKNHRGSRTRKNTGSSQTNAANNASALENDDIFDESEGNDRLTNSCSGHNRTRSDTFGRSDLGMYVLENGLEDDDNSYLLGSGNRPIATKSFNEDTERKKLATIEKLYWPFHNLFDIHGLRRLKPAHCPICEMAPCGCIDEERNSLLVNYNIPKFVPPLTDRKDGGFEMDLTGLHLPMKLHMAQGNDLLYEGKIFYMGIIDILQEYTARKALESQYRSFTAPSRLSASCVPPDDYAKRFLDFFNTYTKRNLSMRVPREEEGIEIGPAPEDLKGETLLV